MILMGRRVCDIPVVRSTNTTKGLLRRFCDLQMCNCAIRGTMMKFFAVVPGTVTFLLALELPHIARAAEQHDSLGIDLPRSIDHTKISPKINGPFQNTAEAPSCRLNKKCKEGPEQKLQEEEEQPGSSEVGDLAKAAVA